MKCKGVSEEANAGVHGLKDIMSEEERIHEAAGLHLKQLVEAEHEARVVVAETEADHGAIVVMRFIITLMKPSLLTLYDNGKIRLNDGPMYGSWQPLDGALDKFNVTYHHTGLHVPGKMKTSLFKRVAGIHLWMSSHTSPECRTLLSQVVRDDELGIYEWMNWAEPRAC